MPYSSSDALNVFLSYASEDADIATSLTSALRDAFVNDVDVTTMSEFQNGINWKQLIEDRIAETDVFVAIATGELKPSHSFTGFEVGSFSFSLRTMRDMIRFPHLRRRMIPFAVLARVPDTVNEFQGIDIDLKGLRDVRFDATSLAENLNDLARDEEDENPAVEMIYRLLSDVEDIINAAKYKDKPTSTDRIRDRANALRRHARELCKKIFTTMLNREKDVYTPKSKLIVRIEAAVDGEGTTRSVERAQLRVDGPCFEAFGFSGGQRSLSWKEFTAHATEDIVFGWRESLNSLISSAQRNSFIDNNSIISFDRKKIFRVFMSRRTIFYSNATEYHIYVVEMLRNRDYGDPDTTTLLKAMEVGLGYRFMFLEGKSEFSPTVFRAENLDKIKRRVLNMITSLNLILQIAEEYKLNDPKTILDILGIEITEDIDKMHERWDEERNALYDAAKSLLREQSVSGAEKASFIKILQSFCDYTRDLNRNYTAAVLGLLKKKVEADDTRAGMRVVAAATSSALV